MSRQGMYMMLAFLESNHILSSLFPNFSANKLTFISSLGVTNSNGTGSSLFSSGPTSSTLSQPSVIALLPLFWLSLGVAGGFLRVACYRELGKPFTYEIPDVAKGTSPAPRLVTTGPYSFVRHPSYLALWIISLAIPLYHLSPNSQSWVIDSGILDWEVMGIAIGKAMVFGWWVAAVAASFVISMRAGDEDRKNLRRNGICGVRG